MSSDLIEAGRGVRTPVEEVPVVMPSARGSRHHWAGNAGRWRWGPFAEFDAQNRGRLEAKTVFAPSSWWWREPSRPDAGAPRIALFHVDRELFVVTRAHETYYRDELRGRTTSRVSSRNR